MPESADLLVAGATSSPLEVTTFHEAVPGHHLQLALAQELDLHPILGELEVGSYSEGWGLYAERLADEMSLYSTPLQRIGMLTLDSLRAARLVVDTGLHAFGWTREEAVDFLLNHSALERSNAEGEIDRYIADPGQATSYMIGRLEIQRLRRHAQGRLATSSPSASSMTACSATAWCPSKSSADPSKPGSTAALVEDD